MKKTELNSDTWRSFFCEDNIRQQFSECSRNPNLISAGSSMEWSLNPLTCFAFARSCLASSRAPLASPTATSVASLWTMSLTNTIIQFEYTKQEHNTPQHIYNKNYAGNEIKTHADSYKHTPALRSSRAAGRSSGGCCPT